MSSTKIQKWKSLLIRYKMATQNPSNKLNCTLGHGNWIKL